ncbi:beta-2 adrenergic receptor-like [Physella acuta]|uniref:beta-2 adrenergic receptor-like n=1 Tax=Physella acuta TaxID=109671 RepID=UPI0027DCDF55|nr:beta-2 adrenergic receptor-like [Physella acuta]
MLPYHINLYSDVWHFGNTACMVVSYMYFLCAIESCILTLIISIDRLMLYIVGSKYRHMYSISSAVLTTLISWCVVVFFTSVTAEQNSKFVGPERENTFVQHCIPAAEAELPGAKLIHICLTVVPLAIVIGINIFLFRKLTALQKIPKFRKQSKVTFSRSASVIGLDDQPSTPQRKSSASIQGILQSSPSKFLRVKEAKSYMIKRAKLLVIWRTFTFLGCWAPYCILLTAHTWHPGTISWEWFVLIKWTVLMKNMLDPLTYARKIPAFRKAFNRFITSVERRCVCPRLIRFAVTCCCYIFKRDMPAVVSTRKVSYSLNDTSTTSSYKIHSKLAIDYLWRDPHPPSIVKDQPESTTPPTMGERASELLNKIHPTHLKRLLPMIMLSGRFSRRSSQKSDIMSASTEPPIEDALPRVFVVKTTSLEGSFQSFQIAEKDEPSKFTTSDIRYETAID